MLVCHVAFAAGFSERPLLGPAASGGPTSGWRSSSCCRASCCTARSCAPCSTTSRGRRCGRTSSGAGLRIFPAYWAGPRRGDRRDRGGRRPAARLRELGLHPPDLRVARHLPGTRHPQRRRGHRPPAGPAWTLAVEISFYVFLPIFAALMAVVLAPAHPEAALAAPGRGARGHVRRVAGTAGAPRPGALAGRLHLLQPLAPDAAQPLRARHGPGPALARRCGARCVPARIVALLDSRLLPWVCWGLAAASFAAVSFWVHVGVTEFYAPARPRPGAAGALRRHRAVAALPRHGAAPAAGRVAQGAGGLPPARSSAWCPTGSTSGRTSSSTSTSAAPTTAPSRRRSCRRCCGWARSPRLIATVSYCVIERPALSLKHRRILPSRRVPDVGRAR